MDKITPGSQIQVTVTSQPTNAAAAKTIVRLLNKDLARKRDNDKLRRIRKENETQHQRGGRTWTVRQVTQRRLAGKKGESGTLKATLDVITDLKSVARFVEVKPA